MRNNISLTDDKYNKNLTLIVLLIKVVGELSRYAPFNDALFHLTIQWNHYLNYSAQRLY